MSEIIKVLLADDSSVVRRILSGALEEDPQIKVVKKARHGAEAVGFFPQCKPDVVILDVEMPQMDGVEAATAIRKLDPTVPIIMFSSLTTKGGEATLDALSGGASDYVTKPSGTGHVSEAIAHIRTQLIPKVRAWGKRRQAARTDKRVPQRVDTTNPKPIRTAGRIEIVAIGISTGGPDVLGAFFKEFPADFSLPVVVVQHMPPVFTGLLAERLNKVCPLEVREAQDAVELRSGSVWIAPGDTHLEAVKIRGCPARLAITNGPPENSCRPSVDVTFRSVVECFGDGTLGVIMTGMGKDGLSGCEVIRNAGGSVIVQDEPSSVVWGMPGAVAKAGLANEILPPTEIARKIIRLSKTQQLAAAK